MWQAAVDEGLRTVTRILKATPRRRGVAYWEVCGAPRPQAKTKKAQENGIYSALHAPGAASAAIIRSKELKRKFLRLGLPGAAVMVVNEHTSKIVFLTPSCACTRRGKNQRV